jgi:HlyD family secretion protein
VTKRQLRFILLAVALLAAGVLLRATLFRERAIEVETTSVGTGPVEDIVVNSEAGTVKARSRARLGVESVGRVALIPHREGSTVKAGDLLLGLESTTERTRLEATRRNAEVLVATLAGARSSAKLAQTSMDRIASLHSRGLASQAQLDEIREQTERAQSEVRAAEARLRSSETAVRLAQDELTHGEIRAPFDGTIAQRLVEIGEEVSPGQPLLELVSLSRVYASAPIDERDAGRLQVGLPVRVTVDTYSGVVWKSRLTRISPVVEAAKEQNRTQEIEADLPADSTRPHPRPGMTADVEVVLERRDRVLRVPTLAVIDGQRVFVIEKGRAVSRDVKVGLRSWEWSEVLSGLRDGERVITSLDQAGLKEGVRVQVREKPRGTSEARSGVP